MRSKHVSDFNHDDSAEGYDDDVKDESFPIRTGYAETLQWVFSNAEVVKDKRVLELGSGSGNLTEKIHQCSEIVCVDVSEEMEKLAREKLEHLKTRKFIADDILGVFDGELGSFHVVMSTYTIHHLLEEEKKMLFNKIWKVLEPGGVAIFGDLMLESKDLKKSQIEKYRKQGEDVTAEAIEEEFFWYVDESLLALEKLCFQSIRVKRFSDLSFGIKAVKPV